MNYFVTTSIPYVNGEPHLGHAMEFVMADVLARVARQKGDEVIFSIGCDEHGGKIAEKAASLGLEPQAFTDKMSEPFQSLAKLLEVSSNRFIRTTDSDHETRAKHIWKALHRDIYKSTYIGWYCTGDEAFFTEKEVQANKGICPNHNRPYEKLEEDNYFFSLSRYSDPILQAIESGELQIYPQTKCNEIVSVIKSGLEDISISRPKDKISWGIPVPGDATQVMYVWFEALMNYITLLSYPEGDDFKNFWPANVQVIGKDILRFHAAIWPAMLMGLNLPLPKNLYVHGFINIDGQKMSKSLGNYLAPREVIDTYGPDAFRYYFLRHIPSYGDGDFTWETFEAAYNNELANELGNGVQRTAAMVQRYLGGQIGPIPEPAHDVAQYYQALSEYRFDRALDDVWERVRGINQYIDEEKPWEIAKSGDNEHLQEVLGNQVGGLIQVADLLEPFLPATAAKIKSVFTSAHVEPIAGTLFPKKDQMTPGDS